MSSTEAICVLVKSSASAMVEALDQGLRAAGRRVIVVPTAYDAIAVAEKLRGVVRHLIVGVDFFGPQEFRLFPLARREWPHMSLVAYVSRGFEYKGHLADLVGADLVLASLDDVARFVESLATTGRPAPAMAPAPPTTPRPGPAPADALPVPVADTLPPQPRPPEDKGAPAPTAPPVLGTSVAATVGPHKAGSAAETAASNLPAQIAPSPVCGEARAAAPLQAIDAAASPLLPPGLAAAIDEEPVPVAQAARPPTVEPAPARAATTSARPQPQPAASHPPEPPLAAGPGMEDIWIDDEAVGAIELTEDELRLLLGEEEGT